MRHQVPRINNPNPEGRDHQVFPGCDPMAGLFDVEQYEHSKSVLVQPSSTAAFLEANREDAHYR